MSTRDANQGAGIESGTSSKQKITDGLAALGKPKPSTSTGIESGWPKAKTQKMSRGYTFKNG